LKVELLREFGLESTGSVTTSVVWSFERKRGPVGPYNCNSCRVWDPENQPSVLAKLDDYKDRQIETVKSGMTLTVPGVGVIPLWVDILLCKEHEHED
jgi:hypothetical protein